MSDAMQKHMALVTIIDAWAVRAEPETTNNHRERFGTDRCRRKRKKKDLYYPKGWSSYGGIGKHDSWKDHRETQYR